MSDPRTENREPVDLERNALLVDRLYRERLPALRAVARRGGIAAEQLDDVVHSALAAVLAAYRGPEDRDQLFSYAATAVRTSAGKAHRRHARKESRLASLPTIVRNDTLIGAVEELAVADLEASDPAELIVRREETELAREQLAKLPAGEREILVLGAAGYGNREIAAIVGISERAVRKRVTRARRRLSEEAG